MKLGLLRPFSTGNILYSKMGRNVVKILPETKIELVSNRIILSGPNESLSMQVPDYVSINILEDPAGRGTDP